MRNLKTLSASVLALLAAPAFAQGNAGTADAIAVDQAAAEVATTRIQEAQDRMAEGDAAPASVDPAVAVKATASIHAAQQEMEQRMSEEGAEGDRAKRGHHRDLFRLFSTLDADGDGSLTEQEIRDGAGSIVSAFDENGDGAISKDDMAPMGKKRGWDERPGAGETDDGAASTGEPEVAAEPDAT